MTTPALRNARITATSLAASAVALIVILLAGGLSENRVTANVIACLLIMLAFATLVAAEASSIRVFPAPADMRAFARRHTAALAILVLGVITGIVLARQADRLGPANIGLLTFIFAAGLLIWLVDCWRFETDTLLRQNTLRLLREHRLIAITSVIGSILAVSAWGVWVQPFSSPETLLAFSMPLIFTGGLWTSLPQVLKTWPTTKLKHYYFVVIFACWIGLALFSATFGNLYCQQADCGGWLLRSPQPVSWSEQQQALRDGVTLDSSYQLADVWAEPTMYQPPHSTQIVLQVYYEYTNAAGGDVLVSIEDNAPVWKRKVDLDAGHSNQPPTVDIAPLVAQTRIGPSDVLRLTQEIALAAHAHVYPYFHPHINLRSPEQAASDLDLSAVTAPIWRIRYYLDVQNDSASTLYIWVDGITGAILKQATE